MSHEPHPRTDRTSPGSAPADDARPNVGLERQRAEGELPGRPTRDPLREPPGEDDDERDTAAPTSEVPPTESVPDEVAEQAARDVDPLASGPDGGVAHEDPMRRGTASSDVAHPPGPDA